MSFSGGGGELVVAGDGTGVGKGFGTVTSSFGASLKFFRVNFPSIVTFPESWGAWGGHLGGVWGLGEGGLGVRSGGDVSGG